MDEGVTVYWGNGETDFLRFPSLGEPVPLKREARGGFNVSK